MLNDYQEAIKRFVIYPGAGTGNKEALVYTALEMTGEAGEYAEKIKKYVRDGVLEPQLVAAELGDVLFAVARAATELNMELADIATLNYNKLLSRQERGKLQGSGDTR